MLGGGGIMVIGLILCLWLSFCSPALAETWMTVKGAAVFTGTERSQARKRAIADAHKEAIYQVFGEDVSTEDLFVNLRLSGSIMGAIPCGRVSESKILQEQVVAVAGTAGSSVLSEYRIELKAKVSPCQSDSPAGFSLDAGLNKTEFREGDPVELTLTASKACHYYVFNILEDEKVLRLVPNRFKSNNRLLAKQSVSFPDAADAQMGGRPIAHLPPKASQTTEAIYVLALRQPVDFSGMGIQEGIYGIYDGRTAFLKAMIRVVATIPVNERAEQLIRYQIKAKTN